ncbi:unnamed protein product [Bursaphelenchus okinawaensis]|uniref:Tudor domain-containing protein n=1 Tax=Bursaphelenchus okinawaensis TaxID=465554 RepID=A0A811LC38_9BILA|nr:unnamed protein product [Bursaphelenchus okinawaensis]CAG9120229.1 unnamed protein product [Bursaphelenchus okinawaensis]
MEKKVKIVFMALGGIPLPKKQLMVEYKEVNKKEMAEDAIKYGYASLDDALEKLCVLRSDQKLEPKTESSANKKLAHIQVLLDNKKEKKDFSGLDGGFRKGSKFPERTQAKPKKPAGPSFNANDIPLGQGAGAGFFKKREPEKKSLEEAFNTFAIKKPEFNDNVATAEFYEDEVLESEDEYGVPTSSSIQMPSTSAMKHAPLQYLYRDETEGYLQEFDEFLKTILEYLKKGLCLEEFKKLVEEYRLETIVTWDNIDAILKYFKSVEVEYEDGVYLVDPAENDLEKPVEMLTLAIAEDLNGKQEECRVNEVFENGICAIEPASFLPRTVKMYRELFHYLGVRDPEPATFVDERGYYLCLDNGSYFRAQIFGKFDENARVKVLAIDIGGLRRVHKDNIFILPGHFYSYPPRAIFFYPQGKVNSDRIKVYFLNYQYIKDLQVYNGEFVQA